MTAPRSLFEIQLQNAYCVKRSRFIREFVEAKSKRLTSLTFVDNRFTRLNYEKLHFMYADTQTIFKRLLVFGDCKIYLKHFNTFIIVVFRQNDHQASFLGMFSKRLSKIDIMTKQEIIELEEDFEYIFQTIESKYIDVLINSFSQLKSEL